MQTDPVCGMEVEPAEAWQVEFEGEIFYFCSKTCQDVFERTPERYARVKSSGQ